MTTLRWLMLGLVMTASVASGVSAQELGVLSDQQIAQSIARTLLTDPVMEEHHITVAVTGGQVYFAGTVHSPVERARAEEIARQTNGVTGIVNGLAVEAPKMWRMDLAIREAIESELSRSLFVKEDRIVVHVEDGVALLTGYVDSLQERRAASDYAYKGGASLVVNKLKIANLEATNAPEEG